MDLAQQIAEKRRKIEEIRRQMVQPVPQGDTPSMIQHKKSNSPSNISNETSPVKQTVKKDQQGNLLGMYLDQKRKKLGQCRLDIFENKVLLKQDKDVFEFGIQCDLQPSDQQKQSDQEQNGEILTVKRRVVKKIQDVLNMKSDEKQQINKVNFQMKQKEKEIIKISNEEINSLIKSQSFGSFFNKSSKLIEKALTTQSIDALESLMINDQINQDDDLKDILTSQMLLSDPTYTQNRVVTAIQWSPKLPETFLSAYSQNEDGNINDQVGVVLIWSLQLKSRPEFYCFSSSPVTSAVFHPFQPSLVLGGLYNGQVVVWDLRIKQTPEKRTTLNSGGHSYPIYGLQVVGSQNAHNVVSVSNDGRLCLWNLSMLNQPQKVQNNLRILLKIVDLKVKSKQPQANQNIEVNVTSLIFPKDDANNYYIGAEDGSIYAQQLHPNQVQSEGQYVAFEEHQAPITSLSLNNPSQQVSPLFSNLMLSSSFDWSAKLWNPRLQKDQCLMTFESAEDYIYDVQWNGNHPTLFSTVDGEGYVDLWDISTDQEAPISRFKTGHNSLNKSSWSHDGQRLGVGDSQGNVQILSLDKRALKVDQNKTQNLETLIKSRK